MPAVTTPSVRFGAKAKDKEIASESGESSTREDQKWLKKACLRRDGNRCVLSGTYDDDWAAANLTLEQQVTFKTTNTDVRI